MTKQDKVICLGREFSSEEERREYFRNELRVKLPELKKIEGFPIGEDEDIINLSDPPYYTACPNPWLNDFVNEWENEKSKIAERDPNFHAREPYASDVSEGKNNPIYTAHTYHTKVPHPAILKYILFYTEPGDIILDGFSGTGMTGIAAQVSGNPDLETRHKIEDDFQKNLNRKPAWGHRNAICGDLSPAASFICNNFNAEVDLESLQEKIFEILASIKKECEWMYQTKHSNGKECKINYVLWSEVLICPNCGNQIIFWEQAVDETVGNVLDEFKCQSCKKDVSKKQCEKFFETKIDTLSKQPYKIIKYIPVVIVYEYKGRTYKKKPDEEDINLLKKIEEIDIPYWFPVDEIPQGDKTNEPRRLGLTSVEKFYTKRNLYALSKFHQKIDGNEALAFIFTSMIMRSTKLNRLVVNYFFNGGGGANGAHLKGTLYVPSLPTETPVLNQIENKYDGYLNAFKKIPRQRGNVITTTNSASSFLLKENSVDYIFTDPPFGSNIMYSELNFIWESWLKAKTNIKQEAIENNFQQKTTLDYQNIMTICFAEYYRILKPNKWMTVEFSNTSASVWNSIQTALNKAGFIVANVSALDKKQGSFNAVSNPTSVKQDLVISCYKPSKQFVTKVDSHSNSVAVWDFVREHLNHLPIHLKKNDSTTIVVERSAKILFDRLITFT
jgi:DNA modification methylase